MSDAATFPPPQKLTITAWLIVIIASIGFAFDIYELLMLPLILRPALEQLVGARPGTQQFNMWLGILFYVPAMVGGMFGLLGGYLTDRLGRRRVLTWSIMLYAISAFLAGFSTNIWMLLVLRCTTFVGVCVEFVAAVAWLAELFPNPHQREKVLGYTQAFSSIGGLLVAIANGLAVEWDRLQYLPTIFMPDWAAMWIGDIALTNPVDGSRFTQAWRYTLMSGLIPALPLVIIRPFLPESPIWSQKRAAGLLRRPSLTELFAPGLRRTTLVTTAMFACSYGAAFGAIQMIPQIVPGLADVRAEVESQPLSERRSHEQKVASEYVKMQEIGGLAGRFLLALLVVQIVSRRKLLRVFLVPGLILMPAIFYFFLQVDNPTFFKINLSSVHLGEIPITLVSLGVFVCGLLTVGQFSFWGNYLPRVYPMHLRGTGESFAANIGGRMIGTSFAAVTGFLAYRLTIFLPGEEHSPLRFAYAAAGVALFVYVVNNLLCFFLPEPKGEELPD
ncbi:MAG: MFS transporter [Gemmataceae bacterium]